MRRILRALGGRDYLSMWREVGAFCVERLVVFPSPHPLLSTVYYCDGSAWGLMTGLSGFASHEFSLHLGAGFP